MKTIEKQLLKSLREEINAALEAVARKNGVTIRAGNCSYRPTDATFKLNVVLIQDDGKPADVLAEDFKRLAKIYGLEPTDLGKHVIIRGVGYTVAGLNRKAHGYPIVLRDSAGERIKCTELEVGDALKRDPTRPILSCSPTFIN